MKCISHYYVELDDHIDVNFVFEKTAVISLSSIPDLEGERESEFGFLRLSIEYELKEYESISDGPIFARPRYLSLLGILSFLIDQPFDVLGSFSSSSHVFPDGLGGLNLPENPKLIIGKKDLTDHLIEFIDILEKAKKYEKSLVFSLLDRWRKGRYLEKETDESLLHDDEVTLTYFHVLELLGDVYSKELRTKSKKLIDSFVKNFNEEIISLNANALKSENIAKSKILANLLDKDISVNSKILFFFKKFKIFSNKVALWVKNLIESRNNVAHGRRVHYEKAIFPVKPFFPLNTNYLYSLKFLRILTAKAICCHLGMTLYDEQWEEIEKDLIIDVTKTKQFLETAILPSIDDSSDEQRIIIFGGLNYHVLNNNIESSSVVKFYRFYLATNIKNEDFLASNIDALAILYESTKDQEIETIIERALIKIHELDCNPHMKFRDMRYFLDFVNFDSPKIEALIINGKIR